MSAGKKKITLENLAQKMETLTREMRGGFAESKNTIIDAIDELALITKRGFDSVDERFNKLEGSNTREHEEMNLKLGEVTFRFELVALQKRVDVLEKKAGVARKSF